jgi:hypothetical protein
MNSEDRLPIPTHIHEHVSSPRPPATLPAGRLLCVCTRAFCRLVSPRGGGRSGAERLRYLNSFLAAELLLLRDRDNGYRFWVESPVFLAVCPPRGGSWSMVDSGSHPPAQRWAADNEPRSEHNPGPCLGTLDSGRSRGRARCPCRVLRPGPGFFILALVGRSWLAIGSK